MASVSVEPGYHQLHVNALPLSSRHLFLRKKNPIFINPDILGFLGVRTTTVTKPKNPPIIEFLTCECETWYAIAYN